MHFNAKLCRYDENLPLLPTPGAPITAIFTSESEDFFRRMLRIALLVIFVLQVSHSETGRMLIPATLHLYTQHDRVLWNTETVATCARPVIWGRKQISSQWWRLEKQLRSPGACGWDADPMRVACASVRRPPFFSTSATSSNLRQSQGCRLGRRNVANIRTARSVVENILRQKAPSLFHFYFIQFIHFIKTLLTAQKLNRVAILL